MSSFACFCKTWRIFSFQCKRAMGITSIASSRTTFHSHTSNAFLQFISCCPLCSSAFVWWTFVFGLLPSRCCLPLFYSSARIIKSQTQNRKRVCGWFVRVYPLSNRYQKWVPFMRYMIKASHKSSPMGHSLVPKTNIKAHTQTHAHPYIHEHMR